MAVRLTDDGVDIEHLKVRDAVLRELLGSQPEDQRPAIVERALVVGARGLLSMGLGFQLADIDTTVRTAVDDALARSHDHVEQLLAAAREAFSQELDPERRSSAVSRALAELAQWREAFLLSVDPGVTGSHTARFLQQIDALVGKGGVLEEWLSVALDPQAEGSSVRGMADSIQQRLQSLHDLLVESRGRREEAEHGTRKGIEFEDVVEARLREAARHLGAIVERTSRSGGSHSNVGDLTVTLPAGQVVVVEAKNQERISLLGRDGILDELDRAKANREACFAVCVSARPAFPAEVGAFGAYGDKLLVVDDGEGLMVDVAVRWAAAAVAASSNRRAHGFDPDTIAALLTEIRALAQLFSTNRRAMTDIGRSLENVRGSLGEMRARLLSLTDELLSELVPEATAEVVELWAERSVDEVG